MTPTHLIIHTAAFRGDVSAETIRRWHTDPKDGADGSVTYKGKKYTSRNELPIEVRSRKGNGWFDIGYHYVVRLDGTLEKGRPDHIMGAHCYAGGMNRVSLGICVAGHGDFERWSEAQEKTTYELLATLCDRYQISPENIKGHNEYDSGKSCPGLLIDMNFVRARLSSCKV